MLRTTFIDGVISAIVIIAAGVLGIKTSNEFEFVDYGSGFVCMVSTAIYMIIGYLVVTVIKYARGGNF